MRSLIILSFLLALPACATVHRLADEHPVLTAVTVAVVAGSLIASQATGTESNGKRIPIPPNCQTIPQSCE